MEKEENKPVNEKLRGLLPKTLDVFNNFNRDGQEMLSDEDENDEDSEEDD